MSGEYRDRIALGLGADMLLVCGDQLRIIRAKHEIVAIWKQA
jgi:hypothetical protein